MASTLVRSSSKQGSLQRRVHVEPSFSTEDDDLKSLRWICDRYGYARRDFNNKRLAAHRIVAGRMLGRDLHADECVDHANHVRLDNRRSNLRVVTRSQNAQHVKPRAGSGIRGATWNKSCNRWEAKVKHGGQQYYCGVYKTAEEAGAAAAAKRRELGFFGEAD